MRAAAWWDPCVVVDIMVPPGGVLSISVRQPRFQQVSWSRRRHMSGIRLMCFAVAVFSAHNREFNAGNRHLSVIVSGTLWRSVPLRDATP